MLIWRQRRRSGSVNSVAVAKAGGGALAAKYKRLDIERGPGGGAGGGVILRVAAGWQRDN